MNLRDDPAWKTRLDSGEWVSREEGDRRFSILATGFLIFIAGLALATYAIVVS